jgi:hypothetical protein
MAQKRYTGVGSKFSQFGFINENGFFIGGNPTAPAAGATASNARQLWAIKNAAPTVPAPEVVQVTGDDGLVSEELFDSIETRSYQATMGIEDLDNEAAVNGTIVNTYGTIQELASDIATSPAYDTLVMHSSFGRSQSAPKGKRQWTTYIIPLSTMTFTGRDAFAERAAGTYGVTIVPQLSSYNPLGFTLTDALNGTCGSRLLKYVSDYPLSLAGFTGDGIVTAFTGLLYDPVRVSGTVAAVNRVIATVASIQTGNTKGFTLSGVAAGNGRGIVLYEFDPASC